jgi:hypothetical protein
MLLVVVHHTTEPVESHLVFACRLIPAGTTFSYFRTQDTESSESQKPPAPPNNTGNSKSDVTYPKTTQPRKGPPKIKK